MGSECLLSLPGPVVWKVLLFPWCWVWYKCRAECRLSFFWCWFCLFFW